MLPETPVYSTAVDSAAALDDAIMATRPDPALSLSFRGRADTPRRRVGNTPNAAITLATPFLAVACVLGVGVLIGFTLAAA